MISFSWLYSTCSPRPPNSRGFVILLRHAKHGRTPLDEGSPERPLPDNTQSSQEIDIDVPEEIRNPNTRQRATADPRLRSCGRWNRHSSCRTVINNLSGRPAPMQACHLFVAACCFGHQYSISVKKLTLPLQPATTCYVANSLLSVAKLSRKTWRIWSNMHSGYD